MNQKLIEELESFKKFKKDFNFTQSEIIADEDNLVCENEILQDKEGNIVSETEKWINVGYKLKGLFPKALSNLFHYDFNFRGKRLSSIESFFQGIKFKDINLQNMIFEYSGIDSNVIKIASDHDWKITGIIYWQGQPIKRDSKEYDDLVDELYISAIQNKLYRNILKKVDKKIIHSIGIDDKQETVFTRYEFEFMINCLVAFIKSQDN